jgi:hypothetical protein
MRAPVNISAPAGNVTPQISAVAMARPTYRIMTLSSTRMPGMDLAGTIGASLQKGSAPE